MLVFVVGWLAVVNLSLAVFNVVPAFPMDGGWIPRVLMARNQPYATATRRAARLARLLAVVGAVLAIFDGAPLLVLVSLFVYVAATSESRAVALRDRLREFTARNLMNRDPHTIGADASVAEFVERVFADRETVFPVIDDDGGILGVMSLDAARSIPESERAATGVESVMDTDAAIVDADRDAFEVVLSMNERRADRLVVVENDAVVGVVTNDDVLSAIQVLEGLRPRTGATPDPPEGYA